MKLLQAKYMLSVRKLNMDTVQEEHFGFNQRSKRLLGQLLYFQFQERIAYSFHIRKEKNKLLCTELLAVFRFCGWKRSSR